MYIKKVVEPMLKLEFDPLNLLFMWTEKVSEIDPRMWLLQLHTVAKIKFMFKNSIVDLKIASKQKFEFYAKIH